MTMHPKALAAAVAIALIVPGSLAACSSREGEPPSDAVSGAGATIPEAPLPPIPTSAPGKPAELAMGESVVVDLGPGVQAGATANGPAVAPTPTPTPGSTSSAAGSSRRPGGTGALGGATGAPTNGSTSSSPRIPSVLPTGSAAGRSTSIPTSIPTGIPTSIPTSIPTGFRTSVPTGVPPTRATASAGATTTSPRAVPGTAAPTTAVITLSVVAVQGAFDVALADISCRDEAGAPIALTAVGPSTVRVGGVGGTTSIRVSGAFHTGAATFSWAPQGRVAAKWTFTIEPE